jgi:hypothetical protein
MFSLSSRVAAVAMAFGVTLGSAGLAAADHGGGGGSDIRRDGACSRSAHWKLKAKPDSGRIEVELEIDANRSGQAWTWRILHDGYVSYHGTRTTRPPSGSFSVQRRVVDMAGRDAISFRARNGAGQTCSGRLMF